ncbi:MAG: DUF3107 domain-containing protein [Bifidobacteriaceae bacterium]|nr:DUF3107 domain-containing protein [Bifidobacteriaceae bacterium]
MDVEIGIENVARPVRFATDDKAETIAAAIKDAMNDGGKIAEFKDSKGKTVIIDGSKVGYAMLGEEEERHVGFGM